MVVKIVEILKIIRFHFADAAYAMLSRNSRQYTGNFAIDEQLLREEGVTDFDKYAVKPGTHNFLSDQGI